MEVQVLFRQALLFAHLIIFAFAISAVLREDLRLFLSMRIDMKELRSTASAVIRLLGALWLTGLAMVFIDIGTDISALLDKPKVLTKIIVVAALTANGILLHALAFPLLAENRRNPRLVAATAVVLGAVSTTSWLYASFIGVARLVAPYMTLPDFLALYLIALCAAISIAILVMRERLERSILSGARDAPANVAGWRRPAHQ